MRTLFGRATAAETPASTVASGEEVGMHTHTSARQDVALLIFRLGVGATLAAHGAQKLFGWFGGGGVEGTAAGMQAMGFLPPRQSAVLAGVGETAGGVALALGLATPVGGAAAASTMAAAGAVHRPAGFFATQGGFEYTGVLALAGTAVAISGPGRWSLDHLLDDRLNRPWMAPVALAVMGSMSAAVITRRNRAVAAQAPAAVVDAPPEDVATGS
jgi:putative oxidoreductase